MRVAFITLGCKVNSYETDAICDLFVKKDATIVDITEEFTYLIQYQQAYQAAAKVMNTIDGIYETTIFKLGNF